MSSSKFTTALLAALTVAAIAAPGAGARPADQFLLAPTTQPAGLHDTTGDASRSAAATVTATSSDGFDWGDAGIGAAAMLSMLGLGAGAVSVARHSRERRPAVN